MQNLSNENEIDLHEHKPVGGPYFHINGFGRRLVLRQRQKVSEMAYYLAPMYGVIDFIVLIKPAQLACEVGRW